jgi:hypothetical protein
MISSSAIQPRSMPETPGHTSTRTASRRRKSSLRWIAEQGRQLADVGAIQGRSWSLAEVCEHLALAFESTSRGSGKEAPPRRWRTLTRFERTKRWFIKCVMLTTGWFPSGVSAPDSVAPSGLLSLPEALDRLEFATEEFQRKCSSPGATWGYHSLLGKMNGRSWRRFHAIHAAHHFSYFAPGRSD